MPLREALDFQMILTRKNTKGPTGWEKIKKKEHFEHIP